MKLEIIKEKINWKIAILWYWKEWKSNLNFLKKLGAKNITIHDKKEIEYKENSINYITWEDYLKNLNNYDLIIKSPWISPYLNDFSLIKDKITTSSEIFLNNYKWKVIWITWTKGKSTTSTLTYLSLKNSWYKTILVWNIWNPVLDEINILSDNLYDYVIYEMSSYMLEWINPELYIWYINNLYECHLDWHLWKENYHNAKLNVLKNAKHKIANYTAKECINTIKDITYFWEGSNILYKENYFIVDNEKIIKDENILLKWEHNKTNISWVLAILTCIIKDSNNKEKIINWLQKSLETFSWLDFRIQDIWTYKGITFINDAMATTPDSTIAAIKTFAPKIWTLFLWWEDSWFHFDKLRKIIEDYKIPNLVLMPSNIDKIFKETINNDYETEFILDLWDYKPKILKTQSLEKAIIFAYNNTKIWDVVLLSTWSPFIMIDWVWNPYNIKWNLFNELVKKYWN